MKRLNLCFDSILPEEIEFYSGNLILTTQMESPKKCEKILLHEDVLEHHPTVLRGVMMQKLNLSFEEENLVLGVDPGQRIGLSIFYYGIEIERSVHNSIEELVYHIIGILSGLRAKRKILKIGDGNMLVAKQIVKMLNLKYCSSFELEFIDERKTSMKIKNFNQRGKRDMLSAKYISQREGYRHSILPLSITG
ncbi:hypothetical protein C5F49_08275 [Nitrosopumilus oxyclinae]|uniref:Pre-16S rRNA-processing nuclease YqgF n=2 Tax=Nitrosopumilus oxyclinae TaxID=1959104 RepID=A0A7D5M2F6_9ARCH|nr:hypothetical protein C5F49_08275 [Nitrosopumilus oxyclinae]